MGCRVHHCAPHRFYHSKIQAAITAGNQLRSARARCKRYAEGSQEYDPRKYEAADRKLQLLEWDLQQVAKGRDLDEDAQGAPHRQQLDPTSTVCAFVVFNNEESFVRCIDDYRESKSLSWFRQQRKELCFMGMEDQPLEVVRAPEPSDIIWENLEATKAQRRARSFWNLGVLC